MESDECCQCFVCDIVFENGERQIHQQDIMLAYIIMEFRRSLLLDDQKCFVDKPVTGVPIPVVTEICEKKCCRVATIPL